MRPETLKVGAKVYSIYYDKKSWKQRGKGIDKNEDDEGAVGRTDHLSSRIWISPEQGDQEARATLLHEALHCLWWNIGVSFAEYVEGLAKTNTVEEGVTMVLEPRLMAFMVDNPIALAYMASPSPTSPQDPA
jgi:hypothetical protein